MPELTEWESFYVIVASSAGALIGLQFIAITLIAERPILRAAEAGAAFATPTVIHFSAVLLLGALLSAPWHSMSLPAACCGLIGLSGAVYEWIVARRMRRQDIYKPQFEDWLCHVLLPLAAYAVLAVAPCLASFSSHATLFAVAGAALLLLFTGIHNTWDSVTYQVFTFPKSPPDGDQS